jgi:hypothetical protein
LQNTVLIDEAWPQAQHQPVPSQGLPVQPEDEP